MIARIVITGAPGSGKTKCLERLKVDSSFADFVFFDELARRLLTENPELRHHGCEFHRRIYSLQTGREEEARGRSFISDRGTVDAFAFHPETMGDVGTTMEREYARYTGVILLGSAARLGEPYYKVDDVRSESIADALEIERAMINVWKGHPRYFFIDAFPVWDDKFARFRSVLSELTGVRIMDDTGIVLKKQNE
jgi:predicted ATPase